MNSTAIKVPTPSIAPGTVNPILKHETHHQGQRTPTSGTSSPEKASSAHDKKKLTWDEHAIEEHDQLRGTRMKIDEPNTPYTHYDHHSDEESSTTGRHPRSPDENRTQASPSLANQWGDIESKLQAVADKRDACPLSPAPSHGSECDSEDEGKKKEKEAKFRMMRKQHYNEVDAMKRFRKEHPGGLAAEDEDDMQE